MFQALDADVLCKPKDISRELNRSMLVWNEFRQFAVENIA